MRELLDGARTQLQSPTGQSIRVDPLVDRGNSARPERVVDRVEQAAGARLSLQTLLRWGESTLRHQGNCKRGCPALADVFLMASRDHVLEHPKDPKTLAVARRLLSECLVGGGRPIARSLGTSVAPWR